MVLPRVQGMAPLFELHAFGIGHPHINICEDFYSIFNNVSTLAPSVATDSGSHGLLFNNSAASDSAAGSRIRRDESYFCGETSKNSEIDLQNFWSSPDYYPPFDRLVSERITFDGPDELGRMSDGVLAELQLREYRLSDQYIIYEPRMETKQGNGFLPVSMSPFGSLQVSDSTLTSGPTMASSLEQDESAEDLNKTIDDITSWPATELFPEIEDHHISFVSAASPCQAHQSMFKEVSKDGTNGKRKRSAESNKYSAEIRISKKIPTDRGTYLKEKAWLGTFATRAQKGRALDVGKYFLSAKKKKNFFDPESEAILSAFRDELQALPLTELVEIVTKMAKHYGENGSLPQSLDCL